MKKTILCMLATGMFSTMWAQDAPQFGKASNKAVVEAMTLEEKARLVVGMGMRMPGAPQSGQGPVVGETQDKVPGAAGTTAEIARLGIPSMVLADGPAGIRIAPTRPGESQTYYCTAFPVATLLASSWDTELVEKTGQAMGNEVKEYGIDVLLGPGMNIHRNPLGGRNFEYYSEDPLVSGKMASAMVRGIQSNGVGVSVKHFAVNNQETNRNMLDVVIGERALREVYLRGFEICVRESQPWTIMSSYNKINGTYTSQSPDLLREILRDDWSYEGFVMTDWFGGDNAVEQMKAGNELIMPGTPQQMEAIIAAVRNGQLSVSVLNENILRILDILQYMPTNKGYKVSNRPDLQAHGQVARDAASEGMVLLKNERSTLPLRPKAQVAAFGIYSYNLISGGTGSGDVNEAYTISLIDGLQNAGFTMQAALKESYEIYLQAEKAKLPSDAPFFMPKPIIPELALNNKKFKDYTKADVAIITIGRIAGEFADRKPEPDYYLTAEERNLIHNVSEAFHAKGKKVIVILNIGGPIDVASWRDEVDAILLSWLPGQEAGNAIADILSGNVNPSGKLATTFSQRYEDEPSATAFPGKVTGEEVNMLFFKVSPMEVDYKEGIYVGYRGFDKYKIEPAYPFGYGLSYTTYNYSNLKLSETNFTGSLKVSVKVTNTGNASGKEVVQLYLSAPAETMDKPVQELKGFAKTKLLRPGESQVLEFDLKPRDLASFDEKASQWVAEAGNYTVKIGASSRDIKLKAEFKVPAAMKLETVSKSLLKKG